MKLSLTKKIYSKDSLLIAAQVLSSKINVYLDESKTAYTVTIEAKRKDVDAAKLAALAGEFGNELLNQEYRFIVGRFNSKISSLIVTQTLMAARGGETPAAAPAEESTPEFKKLVADLVKNAQAEVARTMPKKIPHQGTPLPPVKEDASV
jgi:His-Xaa-Ser system protein HxsD